MPSVPRPLYQLGAVRCPCLSVSRQGCPEDHSEGHLEDHLKDYPEGHLG